MNDLKREVIPFTTQEEWLKARTLDLTSTDIATLFGLGKYSTMRTLWESKKNPSVISIEDSERMAWGRALELPIAQEISRKNGYSVRPFKDYMRIPELRLGSSFDCMVTIEGKEMPFEIKNVDSILYNQWINKSGEMEPPHFITLQAINQMIVSGYDEVAIGALFGGNRHGFMRYKFKQEYADEIIKRVKAFWKSIEDNTPPAWDYTDEKDQFLIKEMYGKPEEDKIMTDIPNEVGVLVEQILEAQADIKHLEADIIEGNRSRLVELTTGYQAVIGNNWKCQWVKTEDKPDSIITPEMVGQVIKGRKGSKSLRVTSTKKK